MSMASTMAADVLGNPANATWKVNPRKCDLDYVRNNVNQHGEMTVDEEDEKGRTPLMIACLHGNKEVAEFLLEHGADMNRQCTQLMNTPLHFTCKWEDSGMPYGSLEHSYGHTSIVAEKVAIAKLLLNHGAVYKENSLGLTPICYAGLHQMRELVNLFGEWEARDKRTSNEKIRGLEFFGVSGTTNKHSFGNTEAYSCLFEAKELQLSCSYLPPRSYRSCEIEKLFEQKECNTLEELEALQVDFDAVQVEGFLIGARIIPNELKPQYYWNSLLHFASSPRRDFADTCSIISFFLRAGKATETPLDQILNTLHDAISHHHRYQKYSHSQLLLQINDVLEVCFNVLSTTWPKENTGGEDTIFRTFVEILTSAALASYGGTFESLTDTVNRVLHILKLIKDRNPSDSTNRESASYYSTWLMLDALQVKLREAEYEEIHYIKHAFSELLEFEGASRRGPGNNTLLHIAVDFLDSKIFYDAEELEMILFIIRMIIRHGCPLDARNSDGYTAKDYAEKRIEEIPKNYITGYDSDNDEYLTGIPGYESDDPYVAQLLELLSGPLSALTLEEIAAQVVLKWKIPFRDYLPRKLQERVTGI